MVEIDDTQLLSLNDFQEVSSFTEDKNIMVWEAANEDPSKISGANFIASMRQLFVEGVNAFLQVDYFSQTAPVVADPSGGETWVSYDGKLYQYDLSTSQWIFGSLVDENTVYIADAAMPIGVKRRYSVIFRNGTYILLSMVDLQNSINDSTPPSPTTTFSSQKVTELIADEKDPIFNAWLIDNAAYLQILLDDAPANPSTKFLNGLRQWVDVAVVGGGGYQAPLYLTNLPSFVAGYKQIAYERQVAGFQTDVTLRNETVLVNTFLFEGQIDATTIDSGNYIFASRAKIDSAGGNTRFRIAPFLRHADGSETVLFTFECDEITYTSYQDVQKSFPYGTITCVETDRFGFRLYLVTSSTSNKTVNLLAGDGYPTFMVTPSRLRHNQLRDLNGDEAHLHVTADEKEGYSIKSYASERVNSAGGLVNLKLDTKTIISNTLTDSDSLTITLPTPRLNFVNESVLTIKIGSTAPNITLPTITGWYTDEVVLSPMTTRTIVFEQITFDGVNYEVWASCDKQ